MTSKEISNRNVPGSVRDAVYAALAQADKLVMSVPEIHQEVVRILGYDVATSSVRSSLNLHNGQEIKRVGRGLYTLSAKMEEHEQPAFTFGNASLYQGDCLEWLQRQPANSIHAVVTDPPYGASEYSTVEQQKMRDGRGGVWRIPPSYDGVKRIPVPRFTTMSKTDFDGIEDFFKEWALELNRVLVPGANVIVATNPLVSYRISNSLAMGGLERRGEIIRLVQTLRGGDRPKGAHEEFPDVSVMPRSQWEPWLVYRKPMTTTVAKNLRQWGTGGFRRISEDQPFGDVIKSAPTHSKERAIAPHPSLKPQAFLRQVVRASLPLGEGIVLDPFAGSGSTLAAAESLGYKSVGVERDPQYIEVAEHAIQKLAGLEVKS